MKTEIQGGYVVAFNGVQHELIRDGSVVFEDDKIIFVGKNYNGRVENTITAIDSLISPGFINTHIHSGSNASYYLLADNSRMDFFGSNYLASAAPLKGKRIPSHLDDMETGVRFSFIHTLKGGATSIIDVGGPEKAPKTYADLVGEIGIRCFTGLRHRDADFHYDQDGRLEYEWHEEKGEQQLGLAIDFIEKFNGANHGRLTAMLFPSHADTCTPNLLRQTIAAARSLGVRAQIHAAQNLIEFHTIMQTHRRTPIEYLRWVGFLAPEASLSHCIFLADHSLVAYPYGDDLKIISDSGASVAHCPLKYLTIGVTMESFDRYLKNSINMALGTDTYPKDMISEMRYAALGSRVTENSFTAGHPRDVFNAATLGGATLLGREDLGRLAIGAKADIVIIDLRNIVFGAVRDPIRSLVESGTSHDVRMVIVDGEILVKNGKYLKTDETELIEKLQTRAQLIWKAVPSWHWSTRDIDNLVPPSFKIS
jgi:cytosine/adenosine deaminase-related metal-dependent hydrolase